MTARQHSFTTKNISLDQWQEFMERLPEISPLIDIACILSPDHEFICINEAAAARHDMDPEGFIGERCYELVHDQDEPIEACPCVASLERGEPMEGPVFEEDGRYYISAAAPIYGADGEIQALAHTVRDVTDRIEREHSQEARSKAMEASIDGMAVLDQDEQYTFVNQAHAYIHGYDDPDSMVGESWQICYEPDEIARFVETVLPLLYENGSWRGEATGVRKDGTTFPQELSLSVTDTGQIVCVVRDITERKQRERELHEKNSRLEEFASAVSHDLRNPLNVAQGRTELAKADCESEHLQYVDSAIERSLEMVDDLLALARYGDGVSETTWVGLSEVLREAWQNVETGDASLEINTNQRIRADRGQLSHILENLLRNAIEHAGDGVTVRVGPLDAESGFYISDDGPGIPPQERASVFRAGYTTADTGTGLGLSITKEIVETHDWEIVVREGEAGGARFEISGVAVSDETE